MTDYEIFGATLRSDIAFSELPTGLGAPTWHLKAVEFAPTLEDPALLGRERVQEGVEVSLFESEGTLRLVFDDTGIFDISPDGSDMSWAAPAGPARLDLVRKDVFGRVLALALHQGGRTVLHGSAVELDGAAIGFIAPKRHGKSTTVSALVGAGGRLLADDLIAVTAPPAPTVLPGHPVVHLWSDSVEQVAGEDLPFVGDSRGGKLQSEWSPGARLCTEVTPLSALYVLAPVSAESSAEPRRERLDPTVAALSLVGHSKIGGLLGSTHQIDVLNRACALADEVPVYRLEVPRELAGLPNLVRELLAWRELDGAVGTAP